MQTNFQKMEFEIVQAPDGGSLTLDIVMPVYLARVTLGRLGTGEGYCDTEIIEIEMEKTIHWQHQEFSRSEELKAALMDFFGKLRDLPSSQETPAETHAFELPLTDRSVNLNALLEPLFTVAGR